MSPHRTANPTKAILVGIAGMTIFGIGSLYVFFFGEIPLSPSDIEVIRGVVTRAEVLRPVRGSDSLEIWLENQAIPFCAGVGFPAAYRQEALARLAAATEVEIGVRPSERLAPRRDRLRGQDFILICSLTVEGNPAFTLDDYNRWHRENQRIGKMVAPTLLACSLLCLSYGLRLRRR